MEKMEKRLLCMEKENEAMAKVIRDNNHVESSHGSTDRTDVINDGRKRGRSTERPLAMMRLGKKHAISESSPNSASQTDPTWDYEG
jgi:nitric oxide reductase activation protein